MHIYHWIDIEEPPTMSGSAALGPEGARILIYDVAIAGAGPVGLMLACELALTGATVVVFETSADARSPLKQLPFGMRGLTVPTVEAFYRRGLLDAIVDPGARRQAGHFAGMAFDEGLIDATRWPWRLPGPAERTAAAEMQRIEDVLAARAQALGVVIRRGLAVEAYEQTTDGVVVEVTGDVVTARWLVGCDGGRSVVRKQGGFEFAGTEPEFTGYTASLDLIGPEKLQSGRNLTPRGMYMQSSPGYLAMVVFDKGAGHRNGPITPEHLQATVREVTGTDVSVGAVRLATSWTDRARQATSYRSGRVFLAGDAAHVHSPLGGQGLNLGLGDAMNLGWKLGAVIDGTAEPSLLDTYHAERHPVAARVLEWSRAQVALMRPDPSDRALGAIVRDLIATKDGATYFAEQVWGVSLRYDLDDPHPLVGRSAPDFEFVDGRRLGSLMRDGGFVLLDFSADAGLAEASREFLRDERYRFAYQTGPVRDAMGLTAVLVRPDGIVAWVSSDVPDLATLRDLRSVVRR